MEILRRQDNSERLRQTEDQLSELRGVLDRVREREGQARQAAALAEQQARDHTQQLTEVRGQAMWEIVHSQPPCPPPPPPLSPPLSFSPSLSFRGWQLPSQRATRQAIEMAKRPHPSLAPPPLQSVRKRWVAG